MSVFPWKRGTAAQRANNHAVPLGGLIGVETDTGRMVGSDGVTPWSALSPLTTTAELYSVGFVAASFGIKCDGVTDDTAAWNAIPANSGDIYCSGTSRITGPVVIPNETMIHWARRNDGWAADRTSSTWSKTLPTVSSITTTGTSWTIVFGSAHGLSIGSVFSLTGFVPTLYNAVFCVAVVVDSVTVQIAESTQPGTITTTGTTVYCPVIVSAGLPGANVFSGGVVGGRTNASDIPNSIACLGTSIQEKSGFFNHIADNWTRIGFAILPALTRGFQNFYYENLESYMSSTVTNPTTAVASGSNAVDLNAGGFAAGTGTLNVTAGDIAAQGITAPGILSVATSGTKVVVTYTGISPGTGPSGQDQLTGCTATPGQSSVLSTGGSVIRGVGVGLLARGGDTNIGFRGHTTCAVEGHNAVMEAAVVLDGVAAVAIDGLHTEEVIVGALLGWRTRVAAVVITAADGGVSSTIPTVDMVRICVPRDGTTTNAITCSAIVGAAGTAVNDVIHNHTHPVSTDPRMGFYHLGYGSPSSQAIMCSSPTASGLQVTSHGMNFQSGAVHLGVNPVVGVSTKTSSTTISNEYGDLFTISAPATATMPASSVSNVVKFITNSSSSTANLTVNPNSGQTVPGGSITLTPGQACALLFDGTNWQSASGQTVISLVSPGGAGPLDATKVAPGLIPSYLAFLVTLNATVWPAANEAVFQRFTVLVAGQYRYMNFHIDVASGNIQYGIVQLSGAGLLNYTRILNSGVIACPTAGDQHADLGSTALAAGEYAFFLWFDNATAQTRYGTNSGVSSTRTSATATSISAGVPASGSISGWSSGAILGGLTLERDV